MLSSMVAEPPEVPPVAEAWTGPEGETAKAVRFRVEPLEEICALIGFESGSRAWLVLRASDESHSVVEGLCRLMDQFHLDELVLTHTFLHQWAAWEAENG